MKLNSLRELYVKNNISEAELNNAIDLLTLLNKQTELDLDVINQDVLDSIILYLVENDLNTVVNFVVMMRYFRMIDRKDLFIHLTKYTGMLGVMENIIKRLKNFKGTAITERILGDFVPPALGTPPNKLPLYVNELMEILDGNLNPTETEKVLAGNNHSVSKEAMLPEKIEYENAASFEVYLKERHNRKIAELTKHYEAGTVWFEQVITKEVIEFVAGNQEILSGKIENGKLYVTKIPYDTLAYINAEDNIFKKYYGCHCPFAREAIKEGNLNISERFCYCSAGFAKFPFEVILDQKLKVKVLESILGDSDICRFEIDLTEINYKK
ncbi:hypothetical protein RJI07_09040 [Mycoplasmatota bacterium WC30]